MEKNKDIGKEKSSSKEMPRTTPVVTRSKQRGEKLKAADRAQDNAESTTPINANIIAANAVNAAAAKAGASRAGGSRVGAPRITNAQLQEHREVVAESGIKQPLYGMPLTNEQNIPFPTKQPLLIAGQPSQQPSGSRGARLDPPEPVIQILDEEQTIAADERLRAGTPNQWSNHSAQMMAELAELRKNQKAYADAVAILAQENQTLKERIIHNAEV